MIEKLKYEFLDFKIYFLTCFYMKTSKKHHKNFDKLILNHKTPSNHSKTNTKKNKWIMLYFCWHGYREENTFI